MPPKEKHKKEKNTVNISPFSTILFFCTPVKNNMPNNTFYIASGKFNNRFISDRSHLVHTHTLYTHTLTPYTHPLYGGLNMTQKRNYVRRKIDEQMKIHSRLKGNSGDGW